MYRCQLCNSIVGPGEKQLKKVVKKRPKEYINEIKDKKGNKHKVYSEGWEIEKELILCNICEEKDLN